MPRGEPLARLLGQQECKTEEWIQQKQIPRRRQLLSASPRRLMTREAGLGTTNRCNGDNGDHELEPHYVGAAA